MINKDRLWNRLQALGEVGKDNLGGVTRFSFTKEDQEAKKLIEVYMKEASLEVMEDNAGNLIGKREGENPNSPSIIIGSHIDTVKQGGIFDGALGVMAGIEVVQTMNEQDLVSINPIEVIAFSDEEGSRFNYGMIGSRAFTGKLELNSLSRQDQDDISIFQALDEAGLHPKEIDKVKRDQSSVKCYLELHIEQGKVLESNDLSVGIVSGIAGPLWINCRLIGESGHAGATPMDMRRDPVTAFGELTTKIKNEASKYPDTVATIGKVHVKPGGVNIIPEEVEFTLDLRSIDEEVRNEVEAAITANAKVICDKYQLDLHTSILQRIEPVPCSSDIQQSIEESSRQLQLETMILPSGAGHDAMQFKDVSPIGMIFVRSKDGISHNPVEFSSKTDCADGVNILYHTVLKLGQ